MPVFIPTGNTPNDFWQADGNIDFALFQAGRFGKYPEVMPIRLHVGNAAFGQTHIDFRHSVWLQSLKTQSYSLVWEKLQMPAAIYESDKENACKFSFRFSPESLMVIELHKSQEYFSVVTLYSHPRQIDGRHLGRYKPTRNVVTAITPKEKTDQ